MGSAHAHAALALVATACAKFDAIGGWGAGALWGGVAMEFDYAVSVYADACEFAEARAAPE